MAYDSPIGSSRRRVGFDSTTVTSRLACRFSSATRPKSFHEVYLGKDSLARGVYQAPIHNNLLTGNVPTLVAGQEQRRPRYIPCGAPDSRSAYLASEVFLAVDLHFPAWNLTISFSAEAFIVAIGILFRQHTDQWGVDQAWNHGV